MVKPKRKSKRTPVRLRHKIEKASIAKQRKQRKLAKNNPEWRSRLKKDPGIPNLFPYKDKLLHEIEEKRRIKEEEAVRRAEEARARRRAADGTTSEAMEEVDGEEVELEDHTWDEDVIDEDVPDDPMAALLASAKARAAEYEADSGLDEQDEESDDMDEDTEEGGGVDTTRASKLNLPTGTWSKDPSRRAFDKVFKQVVDAADVILYVLDARDPEQTRSKEVERMVAAAEGGQKRLLLVLNKIDLVPPPVLKGWLVHLRRYFPTLPLRASGPAPNARTFNHGKLTPQSTSATLLKALKAFAHSRQLKRSISVGVIGYPNVGKSSVINALTSRLGGPHNSNSAAACPVGAEAGVTTSLREVRLDGKLKLLDSPGIVFPSTTTTTITGPSSSKSEDQARLILLNAVPPKQIDDPVPAVALLLKRLSQSEAQLAKLLELYDLPPLMTRGDNADPTTDFLIQVARKRGRLGKGGVPNLLSAAMTVVTDWRDGRIQGWIEAPVLAVAPETAEAGNGVAGPEAEGDRKEIVSEWAAEFKIEGLWGDEAGTVDELERTERY